MTPSSDHGRANERSRCEEPGRPHPYTIEPSGGDGNYLTIRLTGLWSDELGRSYVRDLCARTLVAIQRGGYKGALVDASDYPIQTPAVAVAHRDAMMSARRMFGVRAAMLVTGSRSKLQMMRLARESGQRAFDVRDQALDWLISR